MNQIDELDCDLKKFDIRITEARSETPPAFILNLNPPQKVSNPIITPTEPFHKDSFLSKLAEIDEGLLKLNVVSTLNSEVSTNVQSVHVINEEAKETARVCQGQRSKNHATLRAEATGKQKIKFSQQQGTWKRLNNPDVSRSIDRIASTVDSVLSTKRVHEELSYPNGLPSKKRMVSIEINPTALAEADDLPRPSQ